MLLKYGRQVVVIVRWLLKADKYCCVWWYGRQVEVIVKWLLKAGKYSYVSSRMVDKWILL